MRRALALCALLCALLWPAPAAADLPPATSPQARVAASTSVSGLRYELKRFDRWRVERIGAIGAEGPADAISGDLLLAEGSRETNLRNIVGGGFFNNLGNFIVTGVDRGLFQLNEVYQAGFLASVPGCDSGSYVERHASALPRGLVPGLTNAARYVVKLLRDRLAAVQAALPRAPPEDVLRVAVAAYNAGTYGAIQGYLAGNPDRFTTGGDYSRDVLDRRAKIRRARRELHYR